MPNYKIDLAVQRALFSFVSFAKLNSSILRFDMTDTEITLPRKDK